MSNLNKNFDVLIVGGGIIGLSIARELKKNGVERVGILERNSACGMEASDAAAGMLSPQADTNQADVFFQFCSAGRDLYPQFAAEIKSETGIDIELDQTGTLFVAFNEDELEQLEQRYEWQKNAGLPVEKLSEWEIFKLEPNLSKLVIGALRFPLDWQVENSKIVKALCFYLQKGESQFVHYKVNSLIFSQGKINGVSTENGDYFSPIVIITAGAWTSFLGMPETFAHFINISPVRGQILSFADNQKLFNHVIYSHQGYVVPRHDNRILVGATTENAGFENRTTAAGVASLLQAAFEISPEFRNLSIKNFRSGLRPKAIDGWPLLGEFPENSGLYFATGHYRNGILLAPLTGRIIAEKIVKGIDSSYLQVFNPSRFQR